MTADTWKEILNGWDEPELCPSKRLLPLTYRMIVEPTWDSARLFRLTRQGKNWELIAKMRGGIGSIPFGELIWKVKIRVRDKDAKTVDLLLSELCFWEMEPEKSLIALDPTVCTLEATCGGQHKTIQRLLTGEPLIRLFHYLDIRSGARLYLTSSRTAAQHKAEIFEKIDQVAREVYTMPPTAAAIARFNKVALRLSDRVQRKGLKCPHCQTRTKHMRFIDRAPEGISFFICGACSRSFDAQQYGTLKTVK